MEELGKAEVSVFTFVLSITFRKDKFPIWLIFMT